MSSAGRDREVLVDGLDPGAARVERGAEVHALAVQEDLALVRLERARQRLDQRRLAGAVVADDREDLAGVELEVGAVQGDDVAEALDEPARLEDRAPACSRSPPVRRADRPRRRG